MYNNVHSFRDMQALASLGSHNLEEDVEQQWQKIEQEEPASVQRAESAPRDLEGVEDGSEEDGERLDPSLPSAIVDLICDKAMFLLQEREQFTFNDISQLIESGLLKIGETSIRKGLKHLVDENRLRAFPGSGKRPTYYLLGDGASLHLNSSSAGLGHHEGDEQLLELMNEKETALKQEVENLKARVESAKAKLADLQEDKNKLENIISERNALHRKYNPDAHN